MKNYDEYLKAFITGYLKNEYSGAFREQMIEAFNVGFSAGAAEVLDQTRK